MKRGALSVRSAMTIELIALSLVGTVVAVALILLTSLLHRSTEVLNAAVEGLRVGEAIEGDLLRHTRGSDAAVLATTEAEIESHIQEAYHYALDRVEREQIGEVANEVHRYFRAHRVARAAGANGDAALRAAHELAAAAVAVRRYNDGQLREARAAQARATSWNDRANTIALVAGTLLVLVAAVGLLWIRRFAFRPVERLNEAMREFRQGDEKSRAPSEGPAELRAIAEQFNEMAAELSEQQRQQLAFLSGVVHDLRNPLSALQLSTARLERGRGRLSAEQQEMILGVLRRQIDLMSRMTGDLLDAARIRSGQLELRKEDRDVRELAREAVELFGSAFTSHQLTLSLEEEPTVVHCDPVRIAQVLNNLISNAIKYSPAGTTVFVSVEHREQAVLSVRDQGVGISATDQRRIFEPFRRVGASKESVSGVGLGLFVTKKIVEAHGGALEVESTPGHGSVFRIRLPAQPQPAWRPSSVLSELGA